ncbi:hypothetical protein MKX01_037016 [Papaver californicum]|nr:hypothetical protein MKX01_037016 [Papaver californicum]
MNLSTLRRKRRSKMLILRTNNTTLEVWSKLIPNEHWKDFLKCCWGRALK